MRELNRLGVTSVIDAGGGFQNYPQDYEVVSALHRDNLSTVRLAANLFTQRANQELEDFSTWARSVKAGQGDDMYRINGAGEMLVQGCVWNRRVQGSLAAGLGRKPGVVARGALGRIRGAACATRRRGCAR